MKARLSVLLIVLLVACDKDKDNIVPTDDLWTYADRFYAEAAVRNLILDKSALTIRYVDATEIAPYAGYGTTTPPLIRIVKERWESFTDTGREILMFHELGHAVLQRIHTNEKLPDCSSYKSMMNDTPASIQLNIYTPDSNNRREYYIDELFDPFTGYPSWGGAVPPNKTDVTLDPSTFEFRQYKQATHTGDIEAADGSYHIGGSTTADGSSYWFLPIRSQDIPAGSTLILSFKVKTLTVGRGNGVFATIGSSIDNSAIFSTSTTYYGTVFTNTTVDFVPMTLRLPCYPAIKPPMYVYLALDGSTTGDVWFKDVAISYYHN